MKKLFTLLVISCLTMSCMSIHSVAEDSSKSNYSNPLVLIPYEKYGPRNFSKKLKRKIEVQFREKEMDVEVFAFEQPKNSLTLNAESEMDQKIENTILKDGKDLLLIFQPKNLYYVNGSIQVADYLLTGIDTESGDEVWKANFRTRSYLGPAFFANKSAKKILNQLQKDNIL